MKTKYLVYVSLVLTLANALLPIVPAPYKEIATALFALFTAFFHLLSHTPDELAKAGYSKQ